jgi:O-antigen ligase
MLAGIILVGAFLVSTVSLTNIQDQASTSKWAFVRAGIGRSPQSTSQRESLVSESVGLYKRGNVLGDGPVSTKPRLIQEEAPLIKEAHDDYFAALIERGPLGFIGVLLFVCSVLGRSLFVATKSPRDLLSVIHRPNALMGAAAGTLIGGTVYELLHVRHIWALYAVVAAASLWRSD